MNEMTFVDHLGWAIEEEGEWLVQQIDCVDQVEQEVIYTASLGGRKCEPMAADVHAELIDFQFMPGLNPIYKDFSALMHKAHMLCPAGCAADLCRCPRG